MEGKKVFRAGDVWDGQPAEVEQDTFLPGDFVDVYGMNGEKIQHGIVTQVLGDGGLLVVEFDDTNPVLVRKSPRTDLVAAGMCKKVAE